jgi:hypothetical protein
VGNTAPTVSIAAPKEGATYRDGVPVQLTGSATDKEDGTLSDSKLSWHVVLVHADHTHDFTTLGGKSATFTPATDHDADSHYLVTLTATDSKGLSASKTVKIVPQTVKLTIASTPAGAPVVYAGFSLVAAPHKADAAVGFLTTVAAAPRFTQNGREFVFDGWSDGKAITHDVTIPAQDLTLTARYRDAGPAPFVATPAALKPAALKPATLAAPVLSPAGDKLGPVIRLKKRRSARKLTGTVADPAGVRDLHVALRARRCRWWNAAAGRLARKGRCAKPRWLQAQLRPLGQGEWAWTLKLGARLPRGTYSIRVRAEDTLGNLSHTLAAGKPRLRVG